MKRQKPEAHDTKCQSKRRYPNEGAALQAAQVAGVERWRRAYQCPACGKWHLTQK